MKDLARWMVQLEALVDEMAKMENNIVATRITLDHGWGFRAGELLKELEASNSAPPHVVDELEALVDAMAASCVANTITLDHDWGYRAGTLLTTMLLLTAMQGVKPPKLPQLPPGWTWHPENGRDDVMIKWKAIGPVVSGPWPITAYGTYKHEDTPEGAANAAWARWEKLSGMKRPEPGAEPKLDGQGVKLVPTPPAAAVLLAMWLEHDFDEEHRPPWGCEKMEGFYGIDSDYAWQVYSMKGEGCVAYLKSKVDGPAFVAEVNELYWKGLLA